MYRFAGAVWIIRVPLASPGRNRMVSSWVHDESDIFSRRNRLEYGQVRYSYSGFAFAINHVLF